MEIKLTHFKSGESVESGFCGWRKGEEEDTGQ